MGPVRQNPIQRTAIVYSYVCASHCAQLLHTILHRTDLTVSPLTLQTNSTLVGLHLDRSKHALTSEVMRKIDECEILSALLLLLK